MLRLPISDPSHVAAARRQVVAAGAEAGFDETDCGRLAIVTTELAANVLRHAGGGELLVARDHLAAHGVELLALDRGPGMADLAACMRDGYSTAGTPGNGLGAVQRMADEMAVHSRPGAGTAILVRMYRRNDSGRRPGRAIAAVSVAKPGEIECGDATAIATAPDGKIAVLVADGLGHGPHAAAASAEAVRLFLKQPPGPPVRVLPVIHAGLRPTRGAAIAAALIDPVGRTVTFGGVGNIAGFVTDEKGVRRMVSHAGTAGHIARRMQEFVYPFGASATVVMFSDGLTSSWSPEAHQGLFLHDPTLISAILYRDHARGRDDATVLVWKG